jgi:hypothetical protein
MIKFATPEEIQYAHSILLKDKPYFEQDKIDIIECDESRDVKACPGSGKTTTLLAKLIILANRMPLPNNQGICVLTHTNVAIDEIKNKLGHKADILFRYPNHFGTIQSFVDKFLAIPALQKYYRTSIRKIDNDIANKLLISEFFKLNQYKDTLHTFLYMKLYVNENSVSDDEINVWISKLHIPTLKNDLISAGILKEKGKKRKKLYLDLKKSSWKELNKIFLNKLICSIIYEKRKAINNLIDTQKKELLLTLQLDFVNKLMYNDSISISLTKESANRFLQLKETIFKKGILKFDDAYSLALRYYNDNDCINAAFSSRFKYLFIDEMQDTDSFQLDIIERVMDKNKTIIQRFGDLRQAIYSNRVIAEEQWVPQNPLPIYNSKRFGENIAKVLRYVCCEENNTLTANPDVISLPPVMIVFEKPEDVLPKFCELLSSKHIGNNSVWKTSQNCKNRGDTSYKIKAIGWVGTDNSPDKLTIKSYFPDFNKHTKAKDKVDYDSLKSFLRKQTGGKVRAIDYSNKIVEALLHILSLGNKKYDNGKTSRNYTKTTLLEDFEDKSSERFMEYKINIAKWSKNIHDSETYCSTTIKEIRTYIKSVFCPLFAIDTTNHDINNFIDNDTESLITDASIRCNNVYKQDEIEIEVATIHSVKGETHVATLYLETSYYKKTESLRIANQLTGNYYEPRDTYEKETLKMAHVGMSRPKHFLCMAIQQNNYNDSFDIKNGGMWEVVNA